MLYTSSDKSPICSSGDVPGLSILISDPFLALVNITLVEMVSRHDVCFRHCRWTFNLPAGRARHARRITVTSPNVCGGYLSRLWQLTMSGSYEKRDGVERNTGSDGDEESADTSPRRLTGGTCLNDDVVDLSLSISQCSVPARDRPHGTHPPHTGH